MGSAPPPPPHPPTSVLLALGRSLPPTTHVPSPTPRPFFPSSHFKSSAYLTAARNPRGSRLIPLVLSSGPPPTASVPPPSAVSFPRYGCSLVAAVVPPPSTLGYPSHGAGPQDRAASRALSRPVLSISMGPLCVTARALARSFARTIPGRLSRRCVCTGGPSTPGRGG